jgi:hypothetical protein
MSISAVAAVTKWSRARRSARLLLLCIAQSVPEKGNTTAWLGIDKLAERTMYSRRQVRRLIAELEAIGEVEVVIPDTTGGPGYVRAHGYLGHNGRGLANAYRIRLQKGDMASPNNRKGDILSPLDEKGDTTDTKRGQIDTGKGDMAMAHQSTQRIPEGGGGIPPCTPGGDVVGPSAAADGGNGTDSASAPPAPQAETDAERRARRLSGRLNAIENHQLKSGRWRMDETGLFVKVAV